MVVHHHRPSRALAMGSSLEAIRFTWIPTHQRKVNENKRKKKKKL